MVSVSLLSLLRPRLICVNRRHGRAGASLTRSRSAIWLISVPPKKWSSSSHLLFSALVKQADNAADEDSPSEITLANARQIMVRHHPVRQTLQGQTCFDSPDSHRFHRAT